MRRITYILTFACASLLFGACNDARTPKSTAKHLFEAIEESDFQRAATFTTLNPEEDLELYYAIMQKQQHSITEKGGISNIEIISETYSEEDENKAVAVVQITYGDGSSQKEYCTLIRQDKKWLLDVNLNSK